MKKLKKVIFVGVLLLILVIMFLLINQTEVMNKIIAYIAPNEIKKEISYSLYSSVDNKVKILLTAEDNENGLEKIIYPNNEMELYCNGKNKVSIDYEMEIAENGTTSTFIAMNTKGEEIRKDISINREYLQSLITIEEIKASDSQTVIRINPDENTNIMQYKLGNGTNWTVYTSEITLDGYHLYNQDAIKDGKVILEIKKTDNFGYEIKVEKEIQIASYFYNKEDRIVEGESIFSIIENQTLDSGNYIFKVTGTTNGQTQETIEYPIELYNYNGDAKYTYTPQFAIDNTIYTDIGNKTSEKRMLILKYNGNLEIGEGVTFTPTGTTAVINGVANFCTKKGMLIYCAQTFTNKGNITMTAKGTVNQVGENVYLSKNSDNSYEYIPAVGGAGGSRSINMDAGKNGINRATGGGGAGGTSKLGYAGAGSAGTSYSGGTGGRRSYL